MNGVPNGGILQKMPKLASRGINSAKKSDVERNGINLPLTVCGTSLYSPPHLCRADQITLTLS